MGMLILYLFVALFFSFLCSVLEAVLLSITPFFIQSKIQAGKKYAMSLQKLKKNIDRPLGAILTLNTFAHTIGAAGVGAEAQKIWGNEYLSLISAIMTVIILIFSEIIPKTLGASYWKSLAKFSAHTLRILIWVLYPFVLVVPLITKLFKRKGAEEDGISRDDFSMLAEMGKNQGVIEEDESKVIQNIIHFSNIKVRDIMTPRTVVFALNEELAVQQAHEQAKDRSFSRIPVYSQSIDNVTGFVLKDEIMLQMINQHTKKPIAEIKRTIPAVPSNMTLPKLFDRLLSQKAKLSLVFDEYGGMAGVVTMEDVVETILGLEIVDEMDSVENMQALARETWKVRARKMGILQKEPENKNQPPQPPEKE